jgi:hypothetical protein
VVFTSFFLGRESRRAFLWLHCADSFAPPSFFFFLEGEGLRPDKAVFQGGT